MCKWIKNACRSLSRIFENKDMRAARKRSEFFDDKVKKLTEELRAFAKEQEDKPRLFM